MDFISYFQSSGTEENKLNSSNLVKHEIKNKCMKAHWSDIY